MMWPLTWLETMANILESQPGGAGHASSIRVRLLHAAVRQRIMRLARQRPQYYDLQRNGIPINDLDCVCHSLEQLCLA